MPNTCQIHVEYMSNTCQINVKYMSNKRHIHPSVCTAVRGWFRFRAVLCTHPPKILPGSRAPSPSKNQTLDNGPCNNSTSSRPAHPSLTDSVACLLTVTRTEPYADQLSDHPQPANLTEAHPNLSPQLYSSRRPFTLPSLSVSLKPSHVAKGHLHS